MVTRPNPIWMSLLGRFFPATRPTSSATANIVSERGASESPASSALYSNTIWR